MIIDMAKELCMIQRNEKMINNDERFVHHLS